MTDMKERTDGLLTQKSFSICGCPLKVIKGFKEFCMAETKNDYSMGLKVLLERNDMNFAQEVFAMKIQELEDRLKAVENSKTEEKPIRKTFGGKKDEQTK